MAVATPIKKPGLKLTPENESELDALKKRLDELWPQTLVISPDKSHRVCNRCTKRLTRDEKEGAGKHLTCEEKESKAKKKAQQHEVERLVAAAEYKNVIARIQQVFKLSLNHFLMYMELLVLFYYPLGDHIRYLQ